MSVVTSKINDLIRSVEGKDNFLDVLFGTAKNELKAGQTVVLFGAGALGKEMLFNLQKLDIQPIAFCDNNTLLSGHTKFGLPVISPATLVNEYSNSFIVISLAKEVKAVAIQLIELGVPPENIFRKEDSVMSKLIAMYAMVGTQSLYWDTVESCLPDTVLEYLNKKSEYLDKAYHSYSDQHSKELFIYKLAVLASNLHFYLFKQFMLLFSEPTHQFGLLGYDGTPEDYYYFNNDSLKLENNEIYMDVGAYDGDTVESFVSACLENNIRYEKFMPLNLILLATAR